MRRTIFAAALAVILATTLAACGGEEIPHPVLRDETYLQIQEGREYVAIRASDEDPKDLSERTNAIYQMGYEIQHMTSDQLGAVLIVFRKIAQPEESPSPAGTTAPN